MVDQTRSISAERSPAPISFRIIHAMAKSIEQRTAELTPEQARRYITFLPDAVDQMVERAADESFAIAGTAVTFSPELRDIVLRLFVAAFERRAVQA